MRGLRHGGARRSPLWEANLLYEWHHAGLSTHRILADLTSQTVTQETPRSGPRA